jgi:molybdopterin molybdotransferase
MISLNKALELVLKNVRKTGKERVSIIDALNRVLAEDVFSDVDMPPFNKSAVDGYTCRKEDIGNELEVLETVAAGQIPTTAVGPNQCTKIMTGAMVPEGADIVLMVEHTRKTEYGKIVFEGKSSAPNIAIKAEEVKVGQKIMDMGTLIKPQHIPVLASVGCVNPLVACKPIVAIMSTGDELVEPSEKPPAGKIRNSNSYQLVAQLVNMGCEVNYMGIIPDDETLTDKAISSALGQNDMVILTGGVSMGEFDFVPGIMKKNGVNILFQKVAIKPGRPTVFGSTKNCYIFGLPGNPVSSFLTFEVFAKPLLYNMMGASFEAKEISLEMGVDFKRNKDDRTEFLPVLIKNGLEVIPVRYTGSAHIHALTSAWGTMEVLQGVKEIKKGEKVNVRPI